MKKCQSCNCENSDVMNFCQECGLAFAETPKMVVPIDAAETEAFNRSEINTDSFEKETVADNDGFGLKQSVPTYVHSEKPAGSNTKIYVAVAGIILLLGFGIVATAAGIIYLTFNQSEPNPLVSNPKSTPEIYESPVPNPFPDDDFPPPPEKPRNAPEVSNDVITFPTPNSPTRRGTYRMTSGNGWQLSKIETVPNEDFRVLVKGKIKLGGIGKSVSVRGIKGHESRRIHKEFPTGALLMRTHYPDGRHSSIQPVALGEYWKNEPNETGKIEFVINDNSPENNTGNMTVTVTEVTLAQK